MGSWQHSYWTLANLQSEFCSKSSAKMLEFLSQWPSVILPCSAFFSFSFFISFFIFLFFYSSLRNFDFVVGVISIGSLAKLPETGNVHWNLKICLQKFVQDVLLVVVVCHLHQLCVHMTVRTQGYHLNIVLLQAVHPWVYLHVFGENIFLCESVQNWIERSSV